jgi:hypothetical protein
MIRDRLISRLPTERAYNVGISARDLQGVILTAELKADILAALNSKDLTDVRVGFFFAEQLLNPGHDEQFENDLLTISLRLFEGSDWGIRSNCVGVLVLLGQKLDNYRTLMLRALKDGDAHVRRRALCAYHTFAKPGEIEPLVVFENDDYVTEIGMGSHLIYELRNLALETIEKMIKRKFKKFEKTEVYQAKNVVFWWDWEPFHKWKNGILHKLGLA